MSSSAKSFYIVLESSTYFEFDRDYILAATTLIDPVTVYLTPETHQAILNNPLYAKQFAGLNACDVNFIITTSLPPSPVQTFLNPSLINYDELVDFIVNV